MSSLFVLINCNNFYVSCERVFAPVLRRRPVVVLSNNDGCIVARSNEAKALGIAMGMPRFKADPLLKKNNVAVLSSNYALYADMSARVMQTLATFSPAIEIYSIDEAFLEVDSRRQDVSAFGRDIRKTVLQWTGIPVSVGAATTKTMAKVAGHIAKKSPKTDGVLALTCPRHIACALERTDIADVWGIGRKLSAAFKRLGITTAAQLAKTDPQWIQRTFSITVAKTVLELQGCACIELDDTPEPNKSFTVSRSFGRPIEQKDSLVEALSLFTARAAEKLRAQQQCAAVLTAFAMSSRFDKQNAYYNTASRIFDPAEDSSRVFMAAIAAMGERLFRPGVAFKKAGVILNRLTPKHHGRLDLFTDPAQVARDERLMRALDAVNRTGNHVFFAAEGIDKPWQTRFDHRSAAYTTRWDEIPVVF